MLKTKFFRVAREGATVDGRKITADQISQMAANYKPSVYGARIWLEHFRSIFPDGLFKALGDVLSLKTETDENGKQVLLAELSPTSDLVEMNKDRQKVFTSIEMDTSFSDTGEAYMVGLAVTDTPASLGTEMLQFSRQSDKFSEQFNNVISDPFETEMALAEMDDNKPSLFSKVKDLLSKKDQKDNENFSDINASILAVAESQQQLLDTVSEFSTLEEVSAKKITKLTEQSNSQQAEIKKLQDLVEKTPASNHSRRPEANGGSGQQKAEC